MNALVAGALHWCECGDLSEYLGDGAPCGCHPHETPLALAAVPVRPDVPPVWLCYDCLREFGKLSC